MALRLTHTAAGMGITYFKRYRMEFDLDGRSFPLPALPGEYTLVPWRPTLLDAHVDVKYRSFRFEVDANVFTCFHDREGCSRLMNEIVRRDGFLPGATWLLQYQRAGTSRMEPVGTIQGVWDSSGLGAIQNVGVLPAHRGLGLGSQLIFKSLQGFRAAGLDRAYLEVTAQNVAAFRLYLRLGFRKVKTVYKAADVALA
jgi:ribosomal protein S18 acetylase RimI-like enzyme